MTVQHFMRQGCTKYLAILCMALQLSACDFPVGTDSGTASVSWVPPTERANGDPLSLSEIGGYRVYYGTQTGVYTKQVNVPDGTAQGGTVTGPRGSYFFVVTTYDTAGREGEFSPEFEKELKE